MAGPFDPVPDEMMSEPERLLGVDDERDLDSDEPHALPDGQESHAEASAVASDVPQRNR